jgi:cell division protein ZapA (FtsZ GTPase activity inhibitor)
MIGSLQKYTVTLLGQSYTFVSDEAEDSVHTALAFVEQTLKEVVAHTKTVELQKVALLTAITVALQKVKLEENIALQEDQQAKLMSLLTHVDTDF